jgi:hypothetical protein
MTAVVVILWSILLTKTVRRQSMKQKDLVTSMTAKKSGEENASLGDLTTYTSSIDGDDNVELAVSQFAAFQTSIEQIRETMIAGESTMGVADLEKIEIPAGGGTAWTVPGIGGEESVKELSGVILGWRDVRMYWKLPIEQSDGAMPPYCFSPDARRGLGDPGGACCGCRFAEFGSAARGEGQACKLVRQLFLLRAGNLLPDVVSLPAGSLKSVHDYLKRLAVKGWPCYSLGTNIGLERAKNGQGIEYSRATFTAGEPLPPEQAQRAKEYAAMLKSFFGTPPPGFIARTAQKEEGDVV